MIAFDTNLLVDAADRVAGPSHRQAGALLEKLLDTGTLVMPAPVLAGFAPVTRRKLAMPPADIEETICGWAVLAGCVACDDGDVVETLGRLDHGRIPFGDAPILITSARAGARFLRA